MDNFLFVKFTHTAASTFIIYMALNFLNLFSALSSRIFSYVFRLVHGFLGQNACSTAHNCCNAYGHDKNGNKAASQYNSVLLAPDIIQCAPQAVVFFASQGPALLAS